jgi:hypothetical protein
MDTEKNVFSILHCTGTNSIIKGQILFQTFFKSVKHNNNKNQALINFPQTAKFILFELTSENMTYCINNNIIDWNSFGWTKEFLTTTSFKDIVSRETFIN